MDLGGSIINQVCCVGMIGVGRVLPMMEFKIKNNFYENDSTINNQEFYSR